MSQADVIKEFLVSVGYKVDESSERRVSDGIARMTKSVLALGAVIETAALAVGVGVQKMAVNFDQLYFATQRIGASASDIKSFTYAVSQMGGTADGAMQSVENLARKIRENPGIGKQIARLTGTQIENGKLSLKNLEDMGSYLQGLIAKGQRPKAIMIAEMWGLDEPTMTAMVNGVGKFAKEYKEKMKAAGLDPDKAAADAQKFMQSWRSLFATLGNIVNSALAKIMGEGANDGLLALSKWFERNAAWIAKALHDVAQGFIDVFKGWQDGFGKIDWKEVGAGVGQFAKGIAALVKLFADLVKWVIEAAKAINKFGETTGITGFLNRMAGIQPEGAGSGAAGAPAQGGGSGPSTPAKLWNRWKHTISGGRWGEDPKTFDKGGAAKEEQGGGTQPKPPGAPGKYRPVYNLSDADLSDAVVNTIAGEAHMTETSVDAVVNNMLNRVGTKGYGPSGDLRQVARAPGQYEGYRVATAKQAAFIRERIKAIASGSVPDNTNGSNEYRAGWYSGPWGRKHASAPVIGGNRFAFNPKGGVGPYAPYANPKTIIDNPPPPILAGVAPVPAPAVPKNPFGTINPRSFETPPLGSGINSWNSPVTNNHVSQKVDIKVDGAGDPAAVGASVGRNVERVNADLLRNTQGAAN